MFVYRGSSVPVCLPISANKVAIEALSKNVRQLKIPDISGSASGIKYKVWG